MNIQLTNRIKQNARSFSKGQRLIAKYIEEHYDKVAFMTASKLGATVGVSESTVVRFATEIGYSGYPALQQAMQEMIRNRMTSVQRLEMTSTNIPLDRLLDSSMDQDIDIIRRTKESISHEEFYRAADALVKVSLLMVSAATGLQVRSIVISVSFPGHALSFLRRSENVTLIIKINTNSTTAVAISASRCRSVA